MPFTNLSSSRRRDLFEGVAGRYAHGDALTVGEVELAAGAVVPPHQHPHEQMTCVLSGRVEFVLNDEARVLEPGMVAIIPGGATHRCRALSDARVLDIFTPARDDYR